MNNVYFACTECKVFVDAGYRWAYWQLEEPRVVRQGEAVSVHDLISTESYWRPQADEQSEWLISTLSNAKNFIHDHRLHSIVYGDAEHVMGVDADDYERFAWMNADPDDRSLDPRNLVERLGLRSWEEVAAYLTSRPHKPWWYELPTVRVIAKRKFEELAIRVAP